MYEAADLGVLSFSVFTYYYHVDVTAFPPH